MKEASKQLKHEFKGINLNEIEVFIFADQISLASAHTSVCRTFRMT
jgi:hypothetical protein